MLRNSIILILALLSSVSFRAEISDPIGIFDEGNKFYEEHNFEAAKTSYNQLIDEEYYSPELFLNLGNTYYKLDDLPNTILYYEKALKLSPGDANVIHNLKLANTKVSDKNAVNDSIRLNDWFFNWVSNSPNYWAYNSVYLFLIGGLLLILFVFSKTKKLKKLSFYSGIIALVFGSVSIAVSGFHKNQLSTVEEVVIFKPSINLMSEPSENSSVSFVLHEGTKVKLLDETESWYEVSFSGGKIGWLQKEFVQSI